MPKHLGIWQLTHDVSLECVSVYVCVGYIFRFALVCNARTHAKFGFWFNFAHSAVRFYGKFCQNLKNCQSKSNWKHKRTNEHECALASAAHSLTWQTSTESGWMKKQSYETDKAHQQQRQRERKSKRKRERDMHRTCGQNDRENEQNAPNQNFIPFTNLPCTCKTIK